MRLKAFLASLIISLPIFWGLNVITGSGSSFVFPKVATNTKFLSANTGANLEAEARKEPVKRDNRENLELGAKAAISIFVSSDKKEKILFEKSIQEKLPIASITKLMSADVFLENFDLNQTIAISQDAANQDGGIVFSPGEKFNAKDLLYDALIESSNSAIYALAETASVKGFVGLMNLQAQYLGMQNTYYRNPTGLDPDDLSEEPNVSTAEDLSKLAVHLLDKPLIWEILDTPEFYLYSDDGSVHHKATTTDEFLKADGSVKLSDIVIGGKTGYTPEAKECLLLVLRNQNGGFIVNVVLGSDDRFGEMKKMVDWIRSSYQW